MKYLKMNIDKRERQLREIKRKLDKSQNDIKNMIRKRDQEFVEQEIHLNYIANTQSLYTTKEYQQELLNNTKPSERNLN